LLAFDSAFECCPGGISDARVTAGHADGLCQIYNFISRNRVSAGIVYLSQNRDSLFRKLSHHHRHLWIQQIIRTKTFLDHSSRLLEVLSSYLDFTDQW